MCGGVVQTKDIIEEMAAADQKQKGWHSTRSVMARRRFLQVPIPYCMDTTTQHSRQCIGRRHHTIDVSFTAEDGGNGTSGPGCGGSMQTSAWLLLQETSSDGGGDSSAPQDSSGTSGAAEGSSSGDGTSQGGSGDGSGADGSSNGSASADPVANDAGDGAAQGGESPGAGAAAPASASKDSQPEKVARFLCYICLSLLHLSAKRC
jgi:hypothetical protein